MHHSIPAAPSPYHPPPQATAEHLAALSVPRVGHLQILRCTGGQGICQPQGHPRAFDTDAVSYQNITTERILLEKQADWLIVQGREKTEEVCRGISSLLKKPELHSETRKLST